MIKKFSDSMGTYYGVVVAPLRPCGGGMGLLCCLGWILDLDRPVGHGRYHGGGLVPPLCGLGGVGVWL